MNFSYFFSFLGSHKKALFLAITLMLVESLVNLSIPWVAGIFSTSLLQGTAVFDLGYFQLALLWLLLFLVQAWLGFMSTYKVSLIGADVLARLSLRLFDHVQRLPLRYFDTTRKGELLALLSNDAAIISYFISGVITGLVPSLLLLLGATLIMFSINVPIAAMIVSMVPAFLVVLKVLGRGLRPLSQKIVQSQADSVALAGETFGVIKLVKAFARENQESARFAQKVEEIRVLRSAQLRMQSLLSPLVQFLVSTGVLVVVIVSASYYQAGELSIPNIVTLLMYGMLFARPMSGMAHLYGQTQQALGASTRIIEVMNLAIETGGSVADTVSPVRGDITFDKVSFGYTPARPLLKEVSFHVRSGEIVAILGANGQGKTTLFHLLLRFVLPDAGRITLDAQTLESFDLAFLRKQMGLVSQDIALCNGTVADNIAYGAACSSAKEIENAAIKAGAHDFIGKLEWGYQTHVGENGVMLSGGQRQKIALARVLLSKPSVLLLDEPTSMFDNAGREDFQLHLRALCKGRTVIIVTHDKAVAQQADRVLTIENCSVSETSDSGAQQQ